MEAAQLLKTRLQSLLAQKQQVVLAIDGQCGAGKSTLADALAEKYGGAVIRMDDFFLQPWQRTKERYQEPGGNVDYERFAKEVVPYLGTGRAFCYRRFDCRVMALSAEVKIPERSLLIVEGAYSLHPKAACPYHLSLYLEIPQKLQARRIKERNGPEQYRRFAEEWIPYEEKYFAAYGIRQKAGLVFNQEELLKLIPS